MMGKATTHEDILESFHRTIADAAAYLCCVDEKLTDGHQSAHGVLAQMVFWHEEYLRILHAIAAGEQPNLHSGTYEVINLIARQKYANETMPILAHQLTIIHKQLEDALRALPDWSINFPVKQDSGYCSIAERIRLIDAHIFNRVTLLKRAEAGQVRHKTHALEE